MGSEMCIRDSLYLAFNRVSDVLIILASLPVSIAGSAWFVWYLGYDLSVAVAVGIIALAGVAVEIGVIMLIYLNQYRQDYLDKLGPDENPSQSGLRVAIPQGALQRLRPIVMTVAAITAGLLPIMTGGGVGSEVMQRIAAPMIGGMLSTMVLTLCVIPALYLLWHSFAIRSYKRARAT